MSSPSSSSKRMKSPEQKNKQRRKDTDLSLTSRGQLTRHNIFAPELPGQFMSRKSSVRSNVTAATHDSYSTCATERSQVHAQKLIDKDDDYDGDDGDAADEDDEQDHKQSSFFIPGITGRARCLAPDTDASLKKKTLSPRRPILEKESMHHSLGASSPRFDYQAELQGESASKAESINSTGKQSVRSKASSVNSSCGSETSSQIMNEAKCLYDSVVDSIMTRRNQGACVELEEHEFQNMVKLLEEDVAKMNLNGEEKSLREQVHSIQSLLSDYEQRKKRKSKKKEGAKAA